MKTGIELIAEERKRQIEMNGYSIETDQDYKHAELTRSACAICYESPSLNEESLIIAPDWSWKIRDRHQNNYRQRLIIAGALIAAEIDRLNYIPNEQ